MNFESGAEGDLLYLIQHSNKRSDREALCFPVLKNLVKYEEKIQSQG